MTRRRARHGLVATCLLVLAATTAPAGAAEAPPPQEFQAVNVLPPGESGFFSAMGQAGGSISGDPGDFGEHIDDQRELHWGFGYKNGDFSRNGTPEEPKAGVRIYRDPYGVPSIYAGTGRDVWWGAGYAAAQDRLFLMDAVRRTGEGTLAELTGPTDVPADAQQRVLGYSDAELQATYDGLSPQGKDAIAGYVDGANAWREKAIADPRLLPAEYALLTSVPQPFTIHGVLAGGIYITRYVASEGGLEMLNVATLRELESKFGKAGGRGVFQDLDWQDDDEAVTTVPGSRFSNSLTPPGQRDAVFQQMADYADTIPLALAKGPGTGDLPVPPGTAAATTTATATAMPPAKLAVAKAAASISAWRAAIRGGSFAAAVAPKKTRDGKALLVSMPQLEKSYPSLLWELEIHGAGYDARGVSVPGLPTVGIGYNARVAWALTTGYSKTIDSFIETSRANPVPGRPPQYFHNGAWRDQHCREEVVRYRLAPQGVPVGPPVLQQPLQVCRTVHGPVVSTTTGKSRSVQYAMWGKEIDTIEGILGWNRARNLSEFVAGVRKVTWNENVTWADADGHIGYWHPGIHPMRDAGSDQRLPAPGTGEYDHVRLLTTDEMPHVIDPAQGYLANWNNKPAHGWLDGEGIGYASRPAGKYHRVLNLMDQLAARDDWDFAALRTLDRRAGTRDVRASLYLPLLRRLAASPGLSTRERDLLDLVLAWDGTHYGPGAGTSADGLTDGPAVTIFAAFVDAVRDDLLGGIPEAFRARQTNEESSHVYDATAVDNLVARILDPTASSLTPSRDYTHGRTANAVLKAAFDAALATLADEYGTSDRDAWRRRHPTIEICSLTGGVIGPCVVMPYFDRGSWTHLVGFTAPHRAPGTGGGGGPGGGGQGSGGGAGLPSTGPDPRRTALALLLTAVAAAAIRRARLSRPAGSPMRRE